MNRDAWTAVARGLLSGVLFPAMIVATHAVGAPRSLTVLVVVLVNTVAFFGGMLRVYTSSPDTVQQFAGGYFFALTTGLMTVGWHAGVAPWQLTPLALAAAAALWWMASRPARG